MSRSMMFVGGENLTMLAQERVKADGLQLEKIPEYYGKDVFVWFPGIHATTPWVISPQFQSTAVARAYYYTSASGDDSRIIPLRQRLREIPFDPQVFKRSGGNAKSKGVDIALTKDTHAHAVDDHYDIAMLFAGDGDYLPLIQEVKRRGKNVHVYFFAAPGAGRWDGSART